MAEKFQMGLITGRVLMVVVVLTAIVGIGFLFMQKMSHDPSPELLPDLKKHSIYSTYQFSSAPRVIHFGTQPLYMPTGLITETIKRDRILNEALQKLGFEIRFFSFLKGADVNFFLEAGDLDIGVGGDMPFLTMAATAQVRVPLKMQEGFVSIVARRSMLVSQLRGKTIGYAFGSNAHYALLDALNSEGIKESDVTLISMDVDKMSTALLNEKIDAFSAWEPTPAVALKKFSGFVPIHKKLTTGYLYFLQGLYDQNPTVTRLICTSVLRAILWMQDEKKNLLMAGTWAQQEAEKLSGKKNSLSARELSTLAKSDMIGMAAIPILKKNDVAINSNLHKEFGFLKEINKIPAVSKFKSVQDSLDFLLVLEIFANSEIYALRQFDYRLN